MHCAGAVYCELVPEHDPVTAMQLATPLLIRVIPVLQYLQVVDCALHAVHVVSAVQLPSNGVALPVVAPVAVVAPPLTVVAPLAVVTVVDTATVEPPVCATSVPAQLGAVTELFEQTVAENGLQLAVATTVGHAAFQPEQIESHTGNGNVPSVHAWHEYEQLQSSTAFVHAAPSVAYAAVQALVGAGVAPAAVVTLAGVFVGPHDAGY